MPMADTGPADTEAGMWMTGGMASGRGLVRWWREGAMRLQEMVRLPIDNQTTYRLTAAWVPGDGKTRTFLQKL
jgi:hypothetical protein